ncbi:hypothetical protein G7Z17_g9536 [Cylindrodendrum hubeiense]|uniref:Inosine triphosphate pyrophosphatase n=1 Tax=Cylindrodendrum hubeiense TaxID=595255 RepID=A0A9P5H081_9HYPO|nr:hypothetical protein G7Z17_g9536 [Cylindrodendrum hubeiense]
MAPVVNFISGNANKLREVKAILEPEIEVQSQSLDLEEVQGTLEEVTESKCRRAAELVGFPSPLLEISYSQWPRFKALSSLKIPHFAIMPLTVFQAHTWWDAVFEYEGQTFAEMAKTEKNKISHRGLALTKLQAWFKEEQ